MKTTLPASVYTGGSAAGVIEVALGYLTCKGCKGPIKGTRLSAVDIGAGEGEYWVPVLRKFPALTVNLVDLRYSGGGFPSDRLKRLEDRFPGRVKMTQGDGETLSYVVPTGSADLLTSFGSLYATRIDRRLTQANRILVEGGIAAVGPAEHLAVVDPRKIGRVDRFWLKRVYSRAKTRELGRGDIDWMHRIAERYAMPFDDIVRRAGFSHIETVDTKGWSRGRDAHYSLYEKTANVATTTPLVLIDDNARILETAAEVFGW